MTTTTNTKAGRRHVAAKGDKPRAIRKEQLIRLLSTKAGADAAAISGKLGWQPHTTRAAIAGLRKAGYGIATEKPSDGKPTRYRITAVPKPQDASTTLVGATAATPAAEPTDAG